jgi:hypothetical protein
MILNACAPTWTPVCRHQAMYAAIVVGEKYPTRIVAGKTTTGRHAQAQAYIPPSWVWLGVDGWGNVWVVDQDKFTPDKTYTPDEYYLKTFAGEKWQSLLQTAQ